MCQGYETPLFGLDSLLERGLVIAKTILFIVLDHRLSTPRRVIKNAGSNQLQLVFPFAEQTSFIELPT